MQKMMKIFIITNIDNLIKHTCAVNKIVLKN